jgi:hypothetical protein
MRFCDWFRACFCIAMLIGLPLAGIRAAGSDIGPYLEFPPVTRYVSHASFSRVAFLFIAALDLLMLFGIVLLLKKSKPKRHPAAAEKGTSFPYWGWWGVLIMLAGWVLAWTRLHGFEPLQEHTFCIPWAGYILFVNALCRKRSGSSLLTDAPGKFAMLFPASAIFWWFFEYLNRFVQNWYYVQVGDFSPAGYTLLASMAFSTVLPAVLSTHRLLLTFDMFNSRLTGGPVVHFPRGRMPAVMALSAAAAGLTLIGIYPDYLYPLVWFAPLLIIVSLQSLWAQTTLLTDLRGGDWRLIVPPACAALICGFFWEMWNFYSLTRWEYTIAFVERYHIFAMPLLGYGGYLPFGLECVVLGQLVIGDEALKRGINHA